MTNDCASATASTTTRPRQGVAAQVKIESKVLKRFIILKLSYKRRN
jgi:hypothetical protein